MKLFILSLFATLVVGISSAKPDDKSKASSHTCVCSDGVKGCSKEHTCEVEKGECISIAFDNIFNGTEINSHMYQDCVENSTTFDPCGDKVISITAGKDFYLNSETKCCHGEDKCNKEAFNVTKEDKQISSWRCPSCFALEDDCNATMTKCAKSQDRCINVTGTLDWESKRYDFVIKGCTTSATASVLQKKNAKLDFGEISYSVTSATVSKPNSKDSILRAPGSTVFVVFLPSLLGLLLDRFLF